MAINQYLQAATVVAACLLLLTGCPSPCIEAVYNFGVSASYTPDKDSIHVGDTLYLESAFATTLTDGQLGKQIDYSNAKTIGGTLGVINVATFGSETDTTIDNFVFIPQTGNIYNDLSVPGFRSVNQISYEQNGNQYQLKIAIVAKEQGTYLLSIGDALSVGRNGSKNCEKANFAITLTNTDQHLYLFEDKYGPLSENDQQHSYCFRVY